MFKLAIVAALAALTLHAWPAAAEPTRFTVETHGSGADVILIPGLASPRAVFDDLARRDGGRHRLHLVQINGFGGTGAAANAEGPILEPVVEELHRYIAEHRLSHAALIGHSMGGLIGLMLAQRHPEDLGRLMVVDALPFYGVIVSPQMNAASFEPLAARLRELVLAQSTEEFAAGQAQTAQRLAKTAQAQAAVTAWSVAVDRRVMAQAAYEDMTTDVRPALAGVRTPTSVVYAYDPVMGPPEAVDGLYKGQYADLEDAQFRRIDGSYHFVMLDQPDAFAEAVADFLR